MLRPKSFAALSRVIMAMAGDALIAMAAAAIIVSLRTRVDVPLTRSLLPAGKFPLTAENLLIFSLSAVLALALSGFYDFRRSPRHRPSLFVALPLQMGLVAVAATLLEIALPRTVFVAVPLLEAVAIPGWRFLLARVWREQQRETVLVGNAASLREFVGHLPDWLRLSGMVSVDETGIGDDGARRAITQAEEVIDVGGANGPARRLELLALRGPRGFLCTPIASDALLTSSPFGWIGEHLLVEVRMRGAYGIGAAVKRVFDLVAGTLLLAAAAPLLAILAAAIAVDSRGPVLLRQRRSGLRGQTFLLWKFRTMSNGDGSLAPATDGDLRVTRVGRILRRYRIDELPQLLNVVAGDMSLVGPRPEIPEIAAAIEESVPHFALRLHARPGLAGLAQISAEYDQSPAVKLTYDLQYLCSWTPALDVWILVRSVVTALSGRGV